MKSLTYFSLTLIFSIFFSLHLSAQDTLYLRSQDEVKDIFNKLNTMQRATLIVEPGVYWLDNPDDPEIKMVNGGQGTPYAMTVTTPEINIVGTDNNPENTVFAVNRGQTQGAIGNFTMLCFKSKKIYTENITYGNFCNVDLNYTKDVSKSRKKRNQAVVQAQIAHCWGTDTIIARNCRFISRLNMNNFTGANYGEFHNCYMECTDDALAGNAIYKDCKFTFYSGKPFYASGRGATFDNCDIDIKTNGIQYFTKATSPITLINTRLHCDHDIKLAWCKDNDPSICKAINVTLNGQKAEFDSIYHIFVLEKDKLYRYGQKEIIDGNEWTFDAFETKDTRFYDWHINKDVPVWYYGTAYDGAEGHKGYVQNQKGARLIISSIAKRQLSNITLTICPCKSAGQGFGSALGQYMDICVAMDVENLCGYGLRIQRTADYDHAVVISLIEYKNGEITHLTTPEKCELFNSECKVNVRVRNSELCAELQHNGKKQKQKIKVQNTSKRNAKIMIQHTGSVGASAALIKDVKI